MHIVIRAFGLTFFEMAVVEHMESVPVMVNEVSSIPVYTPEEETTEEEEGRVRLGFQQKSGK